VISILTQTRLANGGN